jgi:succinoglycan biosynthesis protein ExoL
MRIVYFAQDLSDAAVARRVRMLHIGGAEVTLIGFRRTAMPVAMVEGIPGLDLGQTVDGRLASRFGLVMRRALEAGRWNDKIKQADVILARNLEMCTIAHAARKRARMPIPLVYECLDIHGSLLGDGFSSKLLRHWEKIMLRKSAALMVSSEAFITKHFDTLGIALPPVILAENKRVFSGDHVRPPQGEVDPVPPWRIGWFGILRCVKSFDILRGLAQRNMGLLDIEIRGKPTRAIQNLIDQQLPMSNMRFGGPYVQAELAAMYQKVHLTWAVDYFQQGQNSDWLLPNRLYEGGYYNRPAIALAGTETAKWLIARNAGLIIQNDLNGEIDAFLIGLTASHYHTMQTSTAAIPLDDLIYTRAACRRFTARIVTTNQIDHKLVYL